MEKIKVDVHFRKFNGDYNNQVTAVFPYVTDGSLDVVCYAHVGQHSSVEWNYVPMSKPATKAEYAPLKKELESIGYEVKTVNKRSHVKYLKAYWGNKINH
jgi:hypothetical protein